MSEVVTTISFNIRSNGDLDILTSYEEDFIHYRLGESDERAFAIANVVGQLVTLVDDKDIADSNIPGVFDSIKELNDPEVESIISQVSENIS